MKRAPFCDLHCHPQLMNFKHPPHLFAPACPNPTNVWQLWQGTIHRSFLPLFPQSKPQGSPDMLPGWTNSLNSPSHTNKTFVQVHLLQESDLKEFRNRGTLQDITIKKGIAWNPQLLRHSAQSVFFKRNTLFVLLTLQIKYQGQANHDTTFENS